MAVAELLANSSRVMPEDLRAAAAAGSGLAALRPRLGGGMSGGGGMGGGAGLRITNPDLLSPGSSAMAHTPWDGEVIGWLVGWLFDWLRVSIGRSDFGI